ncbi:tripartite tricarboxylate transporter substrate binding protein [Bordetella sp. BOR01]|uniref:Bug family tripartite tricarboxylate transporter substrate binding protein n=1 Tax=Bordetella sp. BOR01 TaxID=2854779 RepID=UPI001C43B758|nr:tripartite tricarboxylate transporter substrate binding protein [Bordetella sp. BOR01]MBV7484395.1 tripartite tricarboxylate transporter substrate binding protein [Bordetella sp. BOR01]
MKRLARLMGCMALGCAAMGAHAQNGSSVRIIVPFAAGGPNDVVARLAAQYIAEPLGKTVIVENKPGATGAIGSQLAADAKPDGNTLLLASSSTMMAPIILKSVRFDPVKDFAPIDLIALDENLLVVHPSVPAKTVQELIDLARAKPGDLNYSTSGQGSSYHLGTELFSSQTGIQMTHVPYKGTAPAVFGLLAGEVQVQFQAVSQAKQHIAAGKVRPLGIASSTRHDDYPDLPTIAEAANLPGFEFATWMGLFAPAGTPEPELAKLREALHKATQHPEFQASLKELGMRPVSEDPQAITARISQDLEKWGTLVQTKGLQMQ